MRTKFGASQMVEEREFVCTKCGHRRQAELLGVGMGAASPFHASGTVEARARTAAKEDVDATISVAVCPSCGARDSNAVWKWWLQSTVKPLFIAAALLALALFIALSTTRASEGELVLIISVFAGSLLVAIPYPAWRKWSSTKQRVHWK